MRIHPLADILKLDTACLPYNPNCIRTHRTQYTSDQYKHICHPYPLLPPQLHSGQHCSNTASYSINTMLTLQMHRNTLYPNSPFIPFCIYCTLYHICPLGNAPTSQYTAICYSRTPIQTRSKYPRTYIYSCFGPSSNHSSDAVMQLRRNMT